MRREQEVPRRSNWLSKNFSCQCHPELKGTRLNFSKQTKIDSKRIPQKELLFWQNIHTYVYVVLFINSYCDGSTATDRVFVCVDNHSYTLPAFDDGPVDASSFACYDEDPNSIFVDASEDYVEENGGFGSSMSSRGEIKNTCCGSTFNQNPKAKLNHVPCNEKNDFSKVNVDADENIYKVVSKIGVRVQNVVDSEIATLFDDDNMLFGFDELLFEGSLCFSNAPVCMSINCHNKATMNYQRERECSISQGYKAPADILSGKEGLEDEELLPSASYKRKSHGHESKEEERKSSKNWRYLYSI
uniref:Uncharacterized protein n=1 Tax=Cucumis melo TaxID=3656 RepID=A0A9I9EJN1_CUCME